MTAGSDIDLDVVLRINELDWVRGAPKQIEFESLVDEVDLDWIWVVAAEEGFGEVLEERQKLRVDFVGAFLADFLDLAVMDNDRDLARRDD